jgi:NurA-like 5'-3' nuclease
MYRFLSPVVKVSPSNVFCVNLRNGKPVVMFRLASPSGNVMLDLSIEVRTMPFISYLSLATNDVRVSSKVPVDALL